MAATCGHIYVVKLLLEYGMHPGLSKGGYEDRTALHLAAESGHLGISRMLVDALSPVNMQDKNTGVTPLAMAALEGHLGIVQFLLSDTLSHERSVDRQLFSPVGVRLI